MSLKQELNREMRNVEKDIAAVVEKTWKIPFNNQTIIIRNEMLRETLYVNDLLLDEHKRKSIWSHILPYSTLKGTFKDATGVQHKVVVKLGGFVKFNIDVKVDGKRIFQDEMKLMMNPWTNKEKIVPYIEKQLSIGQLTDDLPDDDLYFGDGEKLAAGLADQIVRDDISSNFTKKLIKLLLGQLANPNDKNRAATYEKVMKQKLFAYFPEFIAELTQQQYDEEKLQQEAIWLLEHAAHREVVKFAIVLLGFTKCEPYLDRLQKIGQHEEFTGVVLFALRNGASGMNDYVWKLAKTLQGWGKVAALDFLEAHTPEVKYWLLTEGVKNSVMPDYIAMLCAEKGKLDVALFEKEISQELYEGANEIIYQWLFGGSTERLDMYEYAGQVFSRFTYHAKQHANTLAHIHTLAFIADYMEKEEALWEQLYENSWKPHERRIVNENIAIISENEKWKQEALHVLQSDNLDNEHALKVAMLYKLDMSEYVFNQLQQEPSRVHYYEAILETENRTYIEQLARFVVERFSIQQLTEAEEMCVMTIIVNLHEYSGVGIEMLEACLNSDNELLHVHILEVLVYWQKDCWFNTTISHSVKQLYARTKNKEIQVLLKQLL